MVGYPDTQVLDITGPLEVFARSSRWMFDHSVASADDRYSIELVASATGSLKTSGGLALHASRTWRDLGDEKIDTLLVAGGVGYVAAMQDAALLKWLRAQASRVRRLGSICTGALVLGAAGLLAGRAATTHWAYCDRLSRQCPTARVDADALYLRDGNVYTSAGVTAGMDMALGMVEEDWGRTVALAVAQELVMFFRRPGGQSQFSRLLQAQQADDSLGRLEVWVLEHLDERGLSVERLADRAGLSARHFARRFHDRFGTTPAAYVRRARVERARKRLEDGATRMKQVARQCGFPDEQAMSRAFRDALGITPFEYRRRFVG
jgi:transcriptional regulator GlxA family with amidase domain